jgi:hypothetical protein
VDALRDRRRAVARRRDVLPALLFLLALLALRPWREDGLERLLASGAGIVVADLAALRLQGRRAAEAATT